MRALVLAAAMTIGLPSVAAAAPCVSAPLADYVALGAAGCSIGSDLVSEFSIDYFNPLASPIAASDIMVTPVDLLLGLRLDFGVALDAGPGVFFDALIGYSVTATSIGRAALAMSGATASEDGVVTAVEDLCLGGTFLSDQTDCQAIPGGPLIVFEAGFANELTAETLFAPVGFFDVFTEIAIDGGVAGSAGLNGQVSNEFTGVAVDPPDVPEPSTLLMLGAALLGAARYRRRPPSTIHG